MIVIGKEMVKEILEVISLCETPDETTKGRVQTIIEILSSWLSEEDGGERK